MFHISTIFFILHTLQAFPWAGLSHCLVFHPGQEVLENWIFGSGSCVPQELLCSSHHVYIPFFSWLVHSQLRLLCFWLEIHNYMLLFFKVCYFLYLRVHLLMFSSILCFPLWGCCFISHIKVAILILYLHKQTWKAFWFLLLKCLSKSHCCLH